MKLNYFIPLTTIIQAALLSCGSSRCRIICARQLQRRWRNSTNYSRHRPGHVSRQVTRLMLPRLSCGTCYVIAIKQSKRKVSTLLCVDNLLALLMLVTLCYVYQKRYQIVASVEDSTLLLADGVPVRGKVADLGVDYFRYSVTVPEADVTVSLTPFSYGDVDLIIGVRVESVFSFSQSSKLAATYCFSVYFIF